jgi:hypothetical protein
LTQTPYNLIWILQGNRVGCRQAMRLAYKLFNASLCAFFERRGLTT